MHRSHSIVATKSGSKYLQQLCKHFRHKVDVDFNPETARVDFPFGVCLMLADEQSIAFYLQSEIPEGLKRACGVIDVHLLKFGFREDLVIDWIDGLPEDLPTDKLPALQEMR